MLDYQTIYNDIIKAIESNQLRLPTQPEVAVRIRETAENPNVSGKMLADVINKDPALTARLIGIANSPLMRGMSQANTLTSAINRLGVGFVANLATGLAMEQIFHATNEQVHDLMGKVWNQSAAVAAYCMVLSKYYVKQLPQDESTLAGLLHLVGVLPILSYAELHDDLLDDSDFVNLVEAIYPKLGKAILESWKFPREFCEVAEKHLDVKNKEKSKPDYADLIQAANILLHDPILPSFEAYDTTIPAFERLGIDPDQDVINNEEIQEALEAAKQIFKTH